MASVANFTEAIPNSSGDSNSPSLKHLTEYYERLGKWCDQAYEEGIANQSDIPEIREIDTSLDYLLGFQWKQSMPSYRAQPVSNEILSNFWETIGLLTDIKPMFKITDISGADSFSKTEDILNKLAKGWAGTTIFQRRMAFWTMYGMFTSAPAKCYWNPFARGTSGDYMDGDIDLEALSAKSILRLGEGDDIQDDECVIHRRVRTLDWIKRAYPKMGKLVQAEEAKSKYTVDMATPVTVMPQLFQNLSPAAKRMMGASDRSSIQSVYPRAEVREYWHNDDSRNESPNIIWMGPEKAAWGYWVKPGQKMYPRGRLVIRANKVTLYDEPNPYWHRKKPFTLLGLYSVPWQRYALSVLSPWMKQQDILNQIMSGVLQAVKKAVNPILMAPKQAIHPEALRAIDSSKPNLKVSYNANAGTAPTWSQPPNIGAYPLPVYQMILKSMKQMSGSSAMDEASGKKQIPGSDTLDRLSFSKNTPIRMMGRNIEDSVDEVGMMWTGNAIQFYDAAHRVQLLGPQGLAKEDIQDPAGNLTPQGIDSEEYVRRFHFKCDKGTLLNVQRQDRIQIAFVLRKLKDLSRENLFNILDWNINQDQNSKQLAEEAAQMAQAMGGAPPPKGHK
jgi:hypothetical protein